jgi:hypothetical protein
MTEMLATPANMRRLAGGPVRVQGATLIAYSPRTFEQYSATPGDYWHMPEDEAIVDRTGAPMVLAYTHEKVTIVVDPETLDDFDRAIDVLARHSKDGAGDSELIGAAAQILRVLHDRFSEDGEKRGGETGAELIERVCDRWDEFERAVD